MLPGVVLAVRFAHTEQTHFFWPLFVGLCSLCLVTSANYVINEWLDAPSDRFHPTKKNRPLVVGEFAHRFIFVEYAILSALGLGLAAWVSPRYLFWSFLLWVLGIVYNVKPIRTKDLSQIDILSEGLDNPIRLCMGWTLIAQDIAPPLPFFLAYWMASSFQGAVKRLGELRFIGDREIAGEYRRSFLAYTETKLQSLSILYAVAAGLFFVLFLILYRTEYLIVLPFFGLLCYWYLTIGLKENSAAQDIVQLYRKEKLFVAYGLISLILFIVLTFVDLPWLKVPRILCLVPVRR